MRLELFGGTYFKAICLINKATGIWFTHSPLPGSLPQSLLVRYGTLSILQNLGDCFNKAQFISQTTRGHSSNIDFSNYRTNFQVSLILVFSTDKDEEICFPLRHSTYQWKLGMSYSKFVACLVFWWSLFKIFPGKYSFWQCKLVLLSYSTSGAGYLVFPLLHGVHRSVISDCSLRTTFKGSVERNKKNKVVIRFT